MSSTKAKFDVGQLIQHNLFNYRGVIVDVDPIFQNSDEWYEQVALSRPPKDKPWYRVLVHNAVHETYVAEQNLDSDASGEAINHPLVNSYFDKFQNGRYLSERPVN
jgi:heat shock protein HspQ